MDASLVQTTISKDEQSIFFIDLVDPQSHPFEVNSVALDSIGSNTSFGYSGRHDHGNLPTLRNATSSCTVSTTAECKNEESEQGSTKEGRVHTSKLISALMDAKAECDAFLTTEMKQNDCSVFCASPEKKPRYGE